MTHSILAPSSAHIWRYCAGSVRMEALYPEEDSEATRIGTAAHWVASEIFDGRLPLADTTAPNGVIVDDEMIDGSLIYVTDVMSAPGELVIEERVTAKAVHDDCFGTI